MKKFSKNNLKSPATPVVETTGKTGVEHAENFRNPLNIFQHIPTKHKTLIINNLSKKKWLESGWNVLESVGNSKTFQHVPTHSNTKSGLLKTQLIENQVCGIGWSGWKEKHPSDFFQKSFFTGKTLKSWKKERYSSAL